MVDYHPEATFDKNADVHFPFFHPYSRRFHLMLLLMTGYFCTIYMRTNLGMTMTCMVNSSAVLELENSLIEDFSELSPNLNRSKTVPSRCGRSKVAIENVTDYGEELVNDYGGELVWNLNVQDMLFSATFFGALLTTLPAGYIAQRTSPKAILLLTTLNYIVLTAMFPLVAKNATHHLVFVLRFLMGIGEGLIQPTIDTMISKWISISEKGLAASMYTTGAQLAGALGIPFSTILCVSEWQWPAVYYITALFSLIWPLAFFFTVTNKPSQSKIMHEKERNYLEANLPQGDKNERPPIPWKGMLTSIPFFACLFCAFTYSMVLALTQTYQPTFFKEVLYLPLADNGFYGATTQAVIVVVKLSWGVTMNRIKQNRFSNTTGCKISQTFGSIVIAIFLVLLGFFSDCANPWIALILYCGISAGLGSITNGYYASMLSLAPDYTGLLSSIVAMFGIFGMLATTRVVSFFRYAGVLEEWMVIYSIMAGLMLISGIVFLIFGQGEAQEWGIYKDKICDIESTRQSKRVKIASICDTTPIPYKRAII